MKTSTVVVLTVVTILFLLRRESSARKLRDLIPGLYGGDGIFLADPPPSSPFPSHSPHFTVSSTDAINQLNEQIAAEIGVFPFSSSVGGFTFAFDPGLGTFVRTTESLGPLFTERAPTLGRGKFNFHVSYTFFKYNEFEGKDLDRLEVVATHQPDIIPPDDARTSFELDTVRIDVDLDIRVKIFALAATYGVTDRLDIGILVPITRVDMDVKAHAEVVEPQAIPGLHRFVDGPESPDDKASDDATGIGDIVLRSKYHLIRSNVLDIAGALLVKLATGDEDDFLGTGDTTIRPFLVLSRAFSNPLKTPISFTPHLNIGYEINLQDSDRNALDYAIGFDLGSSRFVGVADLIGSHEVGGDGIGTDILTASLGVKWNPWEHVLLLANVQLPLNDDGLRSNVITTVGVEYTF